MKKLHTPNHKLYEQYYVNQAKQKGGSLPAFHGARFQRGYGLGSIFRGLFRWAMPHLQQGAKVIGKKALQTGVNVVQDVLDGDNIKTAVHRSILNSVNKILQSICCIVWFCPSFWGWFWPILHILFARHQIDTWTLALQDTRDMAWFCGCSRLGL